MSYIQDEQQRVVYLHRLAGTLSDDYLQPAFLDAYKRTMAILAEFEGLRTTINRMMLAQKATTDAVQLSLEPAWLGLTEQLDEMAYNQALWSVATLTKYTEEAIKTPAKEFVKRWVDKSVMSLEGAGSGVWSTYVQKNIDGFANQYNKIISDTFQARLNPAQVQPTLRDQAKKLKELNTGINTRSAEMLVRTGVSHYSTQAKRAMIQDNLDIIAREYPLVVFDNRTSDICISINEKYPNGWPVNESPIGYPSYHFGCRTVILTKTKGQEEFSAQRTAVGGKSGDAAADKFQKKQDRLRTASQVKYKGKKDLDIFDIEKLDMRVSFGSWLKDQPKWFIYDTLGKTKAEKFLSGELELSKLTDTKLQPIKVSDL